MTAAMPRQVLDFTMKVKFHNDDNHCWQECIFFFFESSSVLTESSVSNLEKQQDSFNTEVLLFCCFTVEWNKGADCRAF